MAAYPCILVVQERVARARGTDKRVFAFVFNFLLSSPTRLHATNQVRVRSCNVPPAACSGRERVPPCACGVCCCGISTTSVPCVSMTGRALAWAHPGTHWPSFFHPPKLP